MTEYLEPAELTDNELIMAALAMLMQPATYTSSRFERMVLGELLNRVPKKEVVEVLVHKADSELSCDHCGAAYDPLNEILEHKEDCSRPKEEDDADTADDS